MGSLTSVIAACKDWHVLQLNTCQDLFDVLACIVVYIDPNTDQYKH